MFDSGPLTRQRGTRVRACRRPVGVRPRACICPPATCAQPRKKRCSGVKPSILAGRVFQGGTLLVIKNTFGHKKCCLVINSGHKICSWVIPGRGLVIQNGRVVIKSDAWVIYSAFGHTVFAFWDVKNACSTCSMRSSVPRWN